MAFSNPFARDSEGTPRNIVAYKILTILAWLLQFITCAFYTSSVPIWGNRHTPFSLNHVFVSIFWIVLWIAQIVYVWHLFSGDVNRNNTAATVGSHFILYNVLHWAWVMLWVHNKYIVAEVVLIVNFLQLTAVYFRNPTSPRFIHVAVSALPLTFTYFLIFWNGAIMIHCYGTVCRILANVAIWGIAMFAGFFLTAYKDYYVGFATAFLAAGLGVEQFFTKVIALQWPFAFAIMGITFLASVTVAIPGIWGRDTSHDATGGSGERAPLLRESA